MVYCTIFSTTALLGGATTKYDQKPWPLSTHSRNGCRWATLYRRERVAKDTTRIAKDRYTNQFLLQTRPHEIQRWTHDNYLSTLSYKPQLTNYFIPWAYTTQHTNYPGYALV